MARGTIQHVEIGGKMRYQEVDSDGVTNYKTLHYLQRYKRDIPCGTEDELLSEAEELAGLWYNGSPLGTNTLGFKSLLGLMSDQMGGLGNVELRGMDPPGADDNKSSFRWFLSSQAMGPGTLDSSVANQNATPLNLAVDFQAFTDNRAKGAVSHFKVSGVMEGYFTKRIANAACVAALTARTVHFSGTLVLASGRIYTPELVIRKLSWPTPGKTTIVSRPFIFGKRNFNMKLVRISRRVMKNAVYLGI